MKAKAETEAKANTVEPTYIKNIYNILVLVFKKHNNEVLNGGER